MRRNSIFFPILLMLSNIWAFSVPKPSKPNVLLITIDTLRADYLSCYNKTKVETPNIDRMASEGLLFSRAFAHNVLTLPSHINILTGTYPFSHGVRDNVGFRLGEEALLISEILKDKGYKTAAFIGAFPLDDRFGLNQGFDVYDDFYGDTPQLNKLFFVERPAEKVIDASLNWINAQAEGVWFCWIHLFDPHIPYNPPPDIKKKYPSDLYGGEVAYVDQQLGTLFKFFEREKYKDYPLIIITSDHGESLGEHGELTHGVFAYNSTLHIPLIIFQPKVFPKPKVIQKVVRHVDIAPTILDILSLKIPDTIQGRSLLPLVKHPSKWEEDWCYFENLSPNLNRNWAPLYGLIQENYKFISLPIPELYNLESDIEEKNNLATKEKRLLNKLKKDLDNLLSKEKHPVLARRLENRETLEKLRTLGYIADHLDGPKKRNFSAEDDPKNLIALDKKMQKGMIAFKEGMYKKAQILLEQIIEVKPDFVRVYEHLSYIYNEIGQTEKAVKLLERASRIIPDNPILITKLAVSLQEAGQLQRAKTMLEDLVRSYPQDVEILNFLGVTYWKLGNNQEALEVFLRAIFLDKGYASLYNNIGSVYLSEENYFQAEQYFKKAIFYDPNLASAYNGLGVINADRKELPQAIENWKKAVDLSENQHDALYNLCIGLTQMNQFKEAIYYIELYLATVPSKKYGSEIKKMKELSARLKNALEKKK